MRHHRARASQFNISSPMTSCSYAIRRLQRSIPDRLFDNFHILVPRRPPLAVSVSVSRPPTRPIKVTPQSASESPSYPPSSRPTTHFYAVLRHHIHSRSRCSRTCWLCLRAPPSSLSTRLLPSKMNFKEERLSTTSSTSLTRTHSGTLHLEPFFRLILTRFVQHDRPS